MKKYLQIFLILMFTFTTSFSQSIIVQNNFENWLGSLPFSWLGTQTTISTSSISKYGVNPFQGNFACRIQNTNSGTFRVSSNPFNLQANKYYFISIAIKGNVNFTSLSLKNNTSEIHLYQYSNQFPFFHSEWVVYSTIFKAPTDLNNIEFCISRNGAFDIIIDDFKVIELNRRLGYLDVNNISTRINHKGVLSYSSLDSASFFQTSHLKPRHTIFFAHILAAGKLNNSIHIASGLSDNLLFSQNISDFQSGPVANIYNTNYLTKYNRVWEISKQMINHHRTNWSVSNYVMPEVILNWPGNGNINNGEAQLLAPFGDLNSNNIYEPHLGDYPIIKGDKAVFFIINDFKQNPPNPRSLKIEVHGMLYAYNNLVPTPIKNTIFLSYTVFNRSQNTYTDFLLSSFTDFDIGCNIDDYMGCDTTLNFFYGYNANKIDYNCGVMGYGKKPPAQAIIFLNQQMYSFVMPSNLALEEVLEMYNEMNGLRPDGSIYVNNYNSAPTKFLYTGYPEHNTGWTEYFDSNQPWERFGLSSIEPTTFAPGQKIKFDLAYTFARTTDGDHLSSVALLRQHVPIVRNFYNNQNYPSKLITTSDNIENIANNNTIKIHPNPASDYINISLQDNNIDITKIEIFDIHGKIVLKSQHQNNQVDLNIENLNNGFYFIRVHTTKSIETTRFLKK